MDAELTVFLKGRIRVNQPLKGYRFNIDSVILAGFAHTLAGDRVLDLGTGSGILLLLLKSYGHPAELAGVEIDPEMASLARQNLMENGFEEGGGILQGDLRDPGLFPGESFDLLLTNPPYHRGGAGLHSPLPSRAGARHDDSCSFADLAAAGARWLSPGGRFCIVVPTPRAGEALDALGRSGLGRSIVRPVSPIPGSPPHILLIQGRRGNAAAPLELPPLAIRSEPGVYSDEVRLLLAETGPAGPRFFCDAMLGTLARYLRLLGLDTAYARSAEDGWILREAVRGGRVLLTRDRDLVRRARREQVAAFNPDRDSPADQLRELEALYPLEIDPRIPRCLDCNAPALPVDRRQALGRVRPFTYLTHERFRACLCCGKLTWEGSHLARFRKRFEGQPGSL